MFVDDILPLVLTFVTDLDAFLSANVDGFWASQIANPSSAPEARRNAIATFSWVRHAVPLDWHRTTEHSL